MGNQAPLYFWLLKVNPFLDTESPLSIRWLSILCGTFATLSIGLFIYYWTRSVPSAALGAFLSAIDPNLIFYGSEARPYALLTLIAVWQFFVFSLCLFKDPKAEQSDLPGEAQANRVGTSSTIGLVVLSLLLVLTHHTGVLLLGTEITIAMGLYLTRRISRSHSTVVGLLFITGVAVLAVQFTSVSNTFSQRDQWASITSSGELLRACLPSLIYLISIPLLIWGTVFWRTSTRNANMIALTLCVLAWCVLPGLFAGICDELKIAPLALYRYTLVGAIAAPVFAGFAVGSLKKTSFQSIAACAVFAMSIFGPLPQTGKVKTTSYPYANEFIVRDFLKLGSEDAIRMRYESWDSVVNLLTDSNTPVFLFANLLEDKALDLSGNGNSEISEEQIRYFKFPLSCFRQFDSGRLTPRPSHSYPAFLEDDLEIASQSKEVWVVIRGDAAMIDRIQLELHSRLNQQGHSPIFEYFGFTKEVGIPEWLTVIRVEIR